MFFLGQLFRINSSSSSSAYHGINQILSSSHEAPKFKVFHMLNLFPSLKRIFDVLIQRVFIFCSSSIFMNLQYLLINILTLKKKFQSIEKWVQSTQNICVFLLHESCTNTYKSLSCKRYMKLIVARMRY